MTSYNNDPEFKKKAVEAAIRHREMDMLISGDYGSDSINGFKGCSIGCDAFDITGNVPNNPHQTTAKYFGFPEWLEHLRDKIFEGLESLEDADRSSWHVDIKQAIPIGMDDADFDQVKKDFLVWLMEQNIKAVECLDTEEELKDRILSAINGVIKSVSTGEGVEEAEKRAGYLSGEAEWLISDGAKYALLSAKFALIDISLSSEYSATTAESIATKEFFLNTSAYKKQADKLIELFKALKK